MPALFQKVILEGAGNLNPHSSYFQKPLTIRVKRTWFRAIPSPYLMKVKVRDKKEFGRHFCSEVHAVDVTVKAKLQIVYTEKGKLLSFSISKRRQILLLKFNDK